MGRAWCLEMDRPGLKPTFQLCNFSVPQFPHLEYKNCTHLTGVLLGLGKVKCPLTESPRLQALVQLFPKLPTWPPSRRASGTAPGR